jgi:hypothetical protein
VRVQLCAQRLELRMGRLLAGLGRRLRLLLRVLIEESRARTQSVQREPEDARSRDHGQPRHRPLAHHRQDQAGRNGRGHGGDQHQDRHRQKHRMHVRGPDAPGQDALPALRHAVKRVRDAREQTTRSAQHGAQGPDRDHGLPPATLGRKRHHQDHVHHARHQHELEPERRVAKLAHRDHQRVSGVSVRA